MPELNYLIVPFSAEEMDEEVISKTFGVDINDIEHKYLNSGKEIFSFYDSKIGRKRLLENPSDGTLVEFLKEEQNNNADFQSNDYKANSTAILKGLYFPSSYS